MSQFRKLLVTVPVLNQPRWTREIVEQLFLKTFEPATFLIVDDGSDDLETLKILESAAMRHRCLVKRNEENSGVAYSWNRAIEFADKIGFEHIAFLNNDIILPHHWDVFLLKPLEKRNIWLSSFCNDSSYWEGCWFVAKTTLFKELGNFSSDFGRWGGEDTDFMLKMKAGGYEWENVPTKQFDEIGHYGSASAVEIFKTSEERWKHHDKIQEKIKEKWGRTK